MTRKHVLVALLLLGCGVLIIGNFLYFTKTDAIAETAEVKTTPREHIPNKLTLCSRTNTMPCAEYVKDPVREELNAHKQTVKLFEVGEQVTCIYNGVYSWDNGDQFTKTVGVECEIIKASEEYTDIEPGYQHVQVNCLDGLSKLWSDQPGAGMVKGHKLNQPERWMTSNDCYHFVRQ